MTPKIVVVGSITGGTAESCTRILVDAGYTVIFANEGYGPTATPMPLVEDVIYPLAPRIPSSFAPHYGPPRKGRGGKVRRW